MKAACISARETVGIVDKAVPEPRDDWVRVAVSAAGICGSDLHIFHHLRDALKGIQPGHETAGIVDALGDGVDLKLGTKVAIEPLTWCGTCYQCLQGYHNRCADRQLIGVSRPGGMAEFVEVPASSLHVLPDRLDDNVAALTEPMAVCVRGVRLAHIDLGDRVAVLGAGTIGVLSVLAARDAGASEIYVTARYPHQADVARALGATEVFSDYQAMLDALGATLDVVIETVGGTADTITEATALARAGAVIVTLGVFQGTITLPGMAICGNELTLVGSNCYARDARKGDFALGVELAVRHEDLLAPLVTHRFKLDQVAEAYATAADKRSGALKVQLEP